MSISSIKPEMLLPERELVISKSFELRGSPALIVSITMQGGVIKLWLLQRQTEAPGYIPAGGATNRDEITSRITAPRSDYRHFSEISIQGVSLPVAGSNAGVVGHNPMSYMKLQHFAESGADLSAVEDIPLDELLLCEYQLREGEDFPEIDTKKDMPLSLVASETSIEIPVLPSRSFRLEPGEYPGGNAYSFRDADGDRDITFYIDKLLLYDERKETEERFRDERVLKLWRENGLGDDGIRRMREELLTAMEGICPAGQELLLLQYECAEDIQLNFYTTEFLDSPPKRGSSAFVMMFHSGGSESIHGHTVRTCTLGSVPAGFSGPVDVELISRVKRIPEERL